jgi:hypothetical protein
MVFSPSSFPAIFRPVEMDVNALLPSRVLADAPVNKLNLSICLQALPIRVPKRTKQKNPKQKILASLRQA